MKDVSRPQYYRIKRILGLIRGRIPDGKYPNAGTFRRELGISRRTVLRDLDFLRDEEGAPIEYDESRKGYYSTSRTI